MRAGTGRGSRLTGRVLLTLLVLMAAGAPASAAQDTLEVVGLADYDWALETLDGRGVSLAEYRGEVLVINAWATWCAPCVAELASFDRLRRGFEADTGVRFLFISPEDPEPVRAFLRRYGYRDLPVLVEDERMPDAWGLEALPTTWVVDRQGRIVLRHRGAADWDTEPVRRFLRYLAGRRRSP